MGETLNNNIIDIDLSALRKKRIRIDGDDNRIVEINLSDMGVMSRLQDAYDKLVSLANKYNLKEEEAGTDEETDTDETLKLLNILDTEMRELVDFIFQANISEVCANDGTMADPINGQFRFEYIIEKFLALYDANFTTEFKKMSKNVKKHTNKYTGK